MFDMKAKPFYLSDEDIIWVKSVFEDMTFEEKLGQIFMQKGSDDKEFLKNNILSKNVGAVLFRPDKAEKIQELNRFLQDNSKIPLLLAGNIEDGGIGLASNGTYFGKAMQIAATNDLIQAYRSGKVSCSESAALGCNWAFGPVVDINSNFRSPITNINTYGIDPDKILANGLQYMYAAKDTGVAVAPKHFPGEGPDERDQHMMTVVNDFSCEVWDKTYGKTFKGMIDGGALTVMAGHIAMPAYQRKFNPNFPNKVIPATLSKELLINLLRENLGFNGLVISDTTTIAGFNTAMEREKAIPLMVASGCDMIMYSIDFDEDLEFLRKGYTEGLLTEERINEAVLRILAVKASLKLHLKQKEGSLVPEKEFLSIINCKEHEDWAYEAAEKAITLVKDTQNLLPLSVNEHKRILLQMIGNPKEYEEIKSSFISQLREKGFEITFHDILNPAISLGNITEFKKKFDLALYVGNVEPNHSNQSVLRINWANNLPWFVCEIPTMYISLGNPYDLLDVPSIKTYINCYSNNKYVIKSVIEKILGESTFKGTSPIDPFCGRWDTQL